MPRRRRSILQLAAWSLAEPRLGGSRPALAQAAGTPTGLPIEGDMPGLAGATGWINTPRLTVLDLRGKVVLVQFWTYTCINWLRLHAHVRAWAAKYQPHGLVVIGVHTPEFPFEADLDNVRRAVREMRIDYPVAVDTDYAIWQAFRNNYWPALYFVDAHGRIRHRQFGEGAYEQSEMVIQRLLTEAGASGFDHRLAMTTGEGIEAAPDWATLGSAENYLGLDRTENFVGGAVRGHPHRYAGAATLALNHWALSGEWTMEPGFVTANEAACRLSYRFHARDAHLVMGAADPSRPARFRVSLGGAPPAGEHGIDVDADGSGQVQYPRLYQVIRQSHAVADQTLEITFADAGIKAYVFTFG